MRRLGIPLPLVQWTATFCAERQVAVCLDGVRGEMKPAETGVPQGSPVSPVLAIIYAAELAELMEQHARPRTLPLPDDPTPTAFKMYVDDGHLLVSSNSLETNVHMLGIAYRTCHDWFERVGLSSDIDKADLIHHTWRHADRKRELPPITLPVPNPQGQVVKKPVPVIRWLGGWFDERLTFDEHVRIVAGRAKRLSNGLSMLANTVRGLSQDSMRALYLGAIAPVFTYAAPVWWSGKRKHARLLTSIQNNNLRRIAGAFRTTPARALEVDTSIPPVEIQLDLDVTRYATRLHRLSSTSPVIQRLPPAWRDGQPATHPPPLPPHKRITRKRRKPAKTTRLLQIAAKTDAQCEKAPPFALPPWRRTVEDFEGRLKTHTPRREVSKAEAATEHILEVSRFRLDRDHLTVYSDGSLLTDDRINKPAVGAALAGFHRGREVFRKMIALGGRAEVYDAEMVGLAQAARMATGYARDQRIRHIHLFADNTSALQTIYGPASRSCQQQALAFRRHVENFLDGGDTRTVEVGWSPGHQDIPGNERADQLAKKAALKWAPSDKHARLTLTHAYRNAKEAALDAWTRSWSQARFAANGFAPANGFKPKWKPHEHFKDTPREVYARTIQCRTGHSFVGEYYNRFNIPEETGCGCGEPLQTRTHVLYHCPLYDEHRHLLQVDGNELDEEALLGTPDGLKALVAFLAASGAFTKTGRPRTADAMPSWDDFERNWVPSDSDDEDGTPDGSEDEEGDEDD
jgi:ribonuclease HI